MPDIHVTKHPLDRPACEALLAKHHVGRMAFAFHNKIRIALLNYVFSKGALYFRMEPGADATTLLHQQWVAFEIDEVTGMYDWREVTIHGYVQLLSPTESAAEFRDFNQGLATVRSVVPWVLTSHDPMPERIQLGRIHIEELTGHEARSDMPTPASP